MIYPHHQKAIDYITDKFQSDNQVEALLISGSIAHGFNDEYSDVDINIIVSDESYAQKFRENAVTYWESADTFYKGGYFDGKYITWEYLSLAAERGNEPTRFALHDSKIAFDKTGRAKDYIKKIGDYTFDPQNLARFLSQFEVWKWYCGEALRHDDQYLLDIAVSKLILFAGRMILFENKMFFPYHKWFMRVLEDAPDKPFDLMTLIKSLLNDKSHENIARLYDSIKNHKNWSGGEQHNLSFHFIRDTETVWMRQDEFIENI